MAVHWKLLSDWPQFHEFESSPWPLSKCHRCPVCPISCVTFHFIPSIIGSHKNNLYHQCQAETRITISLPPLFKGLIMGCKEPGNRAEPGVSWWLSLLMATWDWITAHSSLLHLSPSSFPTSSHFTCQQYIKEKKLNTKRSWTALSFFNKKAKKRCINPATSAVESLSATPCNLSGSF